MIDQIIDLLNVATAVVATCSAIAAMTPTPTDDSLVAMSELALKRKTGARGLRSILEKLLLDEMYESPSRKDIEQIIIDKENVTDDIQPKMVLKEKKESKDSKPA